MSVPIDESADDTIRIKSTFTTSLTLCRLSDVRNTFSDNPTILNALDEVVQPAIDFLLSQKSPAWTWNYWLRDSIESTTFPYPDDLDDTFVALSAITLHRPNILTGEVFANITETLMSQEVSAGGPYRTWLGLVEEVPDVAVNSNILRFLHLHNIHLPALEQWLTRQLAETDFTSPFYPSTLQPLSFLECSIETLAPETKNILLQKIQAAKNSEIVNRFRDPTKPKIHYFDPARNGVRYGNYSAALDIAIGVEYICKMRHENQRTVVDEGRQCEDALLQKAREKIVRSMGNMLSTTNKDWLLKTTDVLCTKNRKELLIPWYFYADMIGVSDTHGLPIEQSRLLDQILNLNLAGWIAYRTYDDILDTPEGRSDEKILLYHSCMNVYRTMLSRCGSDKSHPVAYMIQLKMDIAIEREHLRNKADALQEKSLGCAIAPIISLIEHRKDIERDAGNTSIQMILRLFRHILTAKQLHDDCHDWQEDLASGFINLAVSNRHTTEQQFWDERFALSVKKILFHTKKALTILTKLYQDGTLKTTIHLEKYVASMEWSAHLALSEKRRADDFREYLSLDKNKDARP